MGWETFVINQTAAAQVLKPGTYGAATTKAVVATTGGTELIATDATNKLRYANISVEAKAKSDGKPITVYIGQGIVPTATLYSYKWLAGHEEKDLELNGQALTALAETGQTININVQTALPVAVTV